MKVKKRTLALLLSMIMVLTFMPTLVFAGENEAAPEGASAVEQAVVDGEDTDTNLIPHGKENIKHEALQAGSYDSNATAEFISVDGRDLELDYETYDGLKDGDKIIITYSSGETITYTFDEEDAKFYSPDDDYPLYYFFDNYNMEIGDTSVLLCISDYDDTFMIDLEIDMKVVCRVASISFSPSYISVWGPSILKTDNSGSHYDISKRYKWNYPDGTSDEYPFALGDTLRVTYVNGSTKVYVCKVINDSYGYDAWFTDGENNVWPNIVTDDDLVPGNNNATVRYCNKAYPITIFVDTPKPAPPSEETCPHHYYNSTIIRKASLDADGIERHTCTACGAYYDTTFPWALDEPLSPRYQSYNVNNYTLVYPKSKSITLWLDNPRAGSVVKVKIGKKTYTKAVKGGKVKIKIKKKPKYGKRVTIGVYNHGTLIGRSYYYDDDDGRYYLEDKEIVYYADRIKRGMTKKQVRCLSEWGDPSETASGSGGRSYFYYDDGSVVLFKKGKVRAWYNAAG